MGIELRAEDIASRTVGTLTRAAGLVRHVESEVLRTVVVLHIEGTLRSSGRCFRFPLL